MSEEKKGADSFDMLRARMQEHGTNVRTRRGAGNAAWDTAIEAIEAAEDWQENLTKQK